MRRIFVGAVMLFAISSTAVLAGQRVVVKHGKSSATGTISGMVVGPDDKPAPHAAITRPLTRAITTFLTAGRPR